MILKQVAMLGNSANLLSYHYCMSVCSGHFIYANCTQFINTLLKQTRPNGRKSKLLKQDQMNILIMYANWLGD